MPQPDDKKLKQVHKLMRQDYSDVPMDFATFKENMQDKDKASKVHELLKNKYDDVPRDFEYFQRSLGLKKKRTQEEIESEILGYSTIPQDYADRRGDNQKTEQSVEPSTKEDISRSFGKGDALKVTKTKVQKEYAEKFPGALTPPEKLNKFQDKILSVQEEYRKLMKEKPVKQEAFQEQYMEEIKGIADDIGLYINDDGDAKVPEQEIDTYKDIYEKNLKEAIEEERDRQKDPFMKDVVERLASSAERLYDIPTNVLAISERIHNAAMKGFGNEEAVSNYWQELAQYENQKTEELRQKSERYNESITELVKNGEIGKAAGETALQLVEQIPQLLVFAGSGAAGSAGKGLGYVATGVGAEEYVNSIDSDMSEGTRIMNSVTKGLSEFAFESATTLPILRSIRLNMARAGEDVVQREMKDMFQSSLQRGASRILKGTSNGLKESAGEVATELTQQWSDAAAGKDVEIGKGLGDVAITSYIIGDAMTRVGGSLSYKNKKEAKQYLKEVYQTLPDYMDESGKLEALELVVKRDQLQDQKSRTADGLQRGYDTQIKQIDQRLNDLAQEQYEANFKPQEKEKGETPQDENEAKKTENKTQSGPKINMEVGGEITYQIGEQSFDNSADFLDEVRKYQGQENTPEITVKNDQETANRTVEILQEGIEKEQAVQQETDQRQEVMDKFTELRSRLDQVKETDNPQEIGREFAQIQDRVPQDKRQEFLGELKKKQKTFRQQQESMELDREQVIDYSNQTTPEIKQDIVESEQVNPESIIASNKEAKSPDNVQPIVNAKNSFIEIDVSRTALEDFHRKYFSARGYLPKPVFDKWVETQSKVKSKLNAVERNRIKFESALKKTYGKTKLGTPKVSKAEMQKLNKALGAMGKEGTIRRERVLKRVPEELRQPLVDMRNDIDRLSQQMIDEGLVEGDLAAKFTDNMGFYLTRSYRAHNDPKWNLDNVPVEVKNKAINFIRKQFPDKTESQITGYVESLLYKHNMPLATIQKGKLGSKDLGILKKRTLENKAIRDLLGEYKDPLYNYSTSVMKMTDLIARNKFLDYVRQNGEGVFLYDTPEAGFNTKIAAEGSKTMEPLNGYYTTPEIAEAFEQFERSEGMSELGRFYIKFNSAVKYGKTIGSPQTHARNFGANYLFHVANGRAPISTKGSPLATLVRDIAKKNDPEYQKYWDRAMELGVVKESVWRGEVHDNIKDATKYHEEFVKYGDNLYKKLAKKGLRAIEKAYQKEDDAHKLFAWEGETRRYKEVFRKKNPNKSDEEIQKMAEEEAARIVRNTMPTYSLATSKAVTAVRRAPIVGTFVSFPAEVLRNSYNTFDIARKEMQDPDTKSIGIQRMAGFFSALSISTAASMAALHLVGKAWDDLEDIRKFLPPWSRNSDIIYLQDKGDGVGTYIDVGYSDPYNYLKKPIIAALRGDSFEDAAIDMLREFSEPFLGEDLLAARIRDLTANQSKSTGEQIYNTELPRGDQIKQMLEYLWGGIQPGGVSSAERIAKSFKEYEGEYGKNYDPVNEIVALMTGQRISDYNISTSFYFRMKDLGDRYRSAVNIYRDKKNRKGVSDEEVKEAYKKANQAAEKVIKEANDLYRSAVRQGTPAYKLERTINNLYTGSFPASNKYKRMVRTGYFQPIEP